ncbi:MAG: SLC26A/SulP transporter family protein [Trueperaceae bacterium]|nr:SLC26A/SulP transporter family protein [Trueperaceae bacterium]MCC6309687.1 SLC26A/SulP transporter family protein [Trueperaceae bacterium]MCO5173823.1 SulP family inorganic anion transporter [Trueperaceae bacterium]
MRRKGSLAASEVSAAEPRSGKARSGAGRAFSVAWFVQNTSVGLVLGALAITMDISLAALLYGGQPEYLGRGIGLVLLGGAMLPLVVTLLTSLPGIFANAQDAPAAVLGALAAALGTQVVAGAPLAGEERFFTMVAIAACTALATGVVFMLFGLFRLGSLVRYLPYPVLGGFMAGTGWLLLTGGVGVMSGVRPSLHYLTDLLAADRLVLWAPGVALAVTLLVLTRLYRHFLVWPVTMLIVTIGFYVVMAVTGGDVDGWRARGLLLGPFPAGSLLAPFKASELQAVRWDVVLDHLPTMASAILIALIALLLNAIGVERVTGRKGDLNRELRAAGLGNLLAGGLGGSPGYQSLSFSTFNFTAGTGSRYAPIVAVGAMAACLLFGAGVVALVPKAVVGGLLAYFGLKFLHQWLYEALFDLPLSEYLVVVAILAVIVVAGVLPGVGVGLVLTVVLFVISSSRTDAVRYALGGADLRSRVTRSAAELARLAEHGGELMVVQLQGFLFFGTATALLERLERRVRSGPPVRSVILDFSRVSGVDATGLATIEDVFKLGESSGFELLLSAVPERLYRRLGRRRQGGEEAGAAFRFAKLDTALEHAEERLLERWDAKRDARGTEADAVAYYSGAGFDFADLLPYLTRRELRAGEVLIHKGDKADELYFLVEGQMTAVAEGGNGATTRLETLRSGGLLGELGFYRGGLRSATVRADRESTLLVLGEAALARLTAEAPGLAADLHREVARLMAGRVLHLMAAVDALER